jgi:hypothetical protein
MGMVFGKVAEETPKFALVTTKAAYQVRAYQPSVRAALGRLSALSVSL